MTPKRGTRRTVKADRTVRSGRLAKAKQFLQVADDARELAEDEDAAAQLSTLLGMKTRAGYGHDPVSRASLMRAERAARALVERAAL